MVGMGVRPGDREFGLMLVMWTRIPRRYTSHRLRAGRMVRSCSASRTYDTRSTGDGDDLFEAVSTLTRNPMGRYHRLFPGGSTIERRPRHRLQPAPRCSARPPIERLGPPSGRAWARRAETPYDSSPAGAAAELLFARDCFAPHPHWTRADTGIALRVVAGLTLAVSTAIAVGLYDRVLHGTFSVRRSALGVRLRFHDTRLKTGPTSSVRSTMQPRHAGALFATIIDAICTLSLQDRPCSRIKPHAECYRDSLAAIIRPPRP